MNNQCTYIPQDTFRKEIHKKFKERFSSVAEPNGLKGGRAGRFSGAKLERDPKKGWKSTLATVRPDGYEVTVQRGGPDGKLAGVEIMTYSPGLGQLQLTTKQYQGKKTCFVVPAKTEDLGL